MYFFIKYTNIPQKRGAIAPLFYFRLNETPNPKLSLNPGFKL